MSQAMHLVLAGLISLGAHVSLLFWQSPPPHAGNTRLVVRLSHHQLMESKSTSTRVQETKTVPEPLSAAVASITPDEANPMASLFPPGIALGSEALDSPLLPLEDLNLEPEGGFPPELSGRITLDVLVNEDGHPIWLGTATSELDTETVQFLSEKFAQAKFTKPTVRGGASKVLIRIEIQIGQRATD